MIKAYLGLDYGEKRVGVSVGNDYAKLAAPLTTLSNDPNLIDELKRLAKEHQAGNLVVGLPRGLDGQETAQTKRVRDFASRLEAAGLSVLLQDEAVTSEMAKARGASSKAVDQEAATIILQDHLDNL